MELYKDANIIVVVPLSHRALQKYAHKCQWCINDDKSEWEDYHQGKHAIIIQRNPKRDKIGISGRETDEEIFLIAKFDNGESTFDDICKMLEYDFLDEEEMKDYYVTISNDINNFSTNIVYYSPEGGVYDMGDNYLWNFNYEITDIPNVTPEVIQIMDDYLIENEEMSLQESIKRILKEEVTSKQSKLLEYINQNGALTTIKLLGGLDNLKRQLKGTNWMTRDVMLNTIIDVCKEMRGFSMAELGLGEINLNESNGLLRNLSYIDKNGIEIVTYEKDEDGDYNEEPVDYLSFNYDSKFRNGNYVLDTIHLYEIFDAVIDTYTNYDKFLYR